MIVRLIIMSIHSHLIGITAVRDGGVQSDFAILLMIHRADFESILVSSDETRLLTAIAGGTGKHDRCLGKDAGSSVGVGAIFGINGWELNDEK